MSKRLLTVMGGTNPYLAGLKYLQDTFVTDETNPLTTPRTCEPGGGTFVITDTGSYLSISTDLVIGGGTGTYGDPMLISGSSYNRVLGLELLVSAAITDVTSEIEFGFDNATGTGNLDSDAIRIISDTAKVRTVNTDGVVLPYVPTDTTALKYGIILRPNGAFYLIHNGTNWRLVGYNFGVHDNVSPVKIGISNKSAAGTVSEILLQKYKLIKPYVSDTFNRADGSLGLTNGLVEQEGVVGNKAWSSTSWLIDTYKAKPVLTLDATEKITDGSLEATYTNGLCDTLTAEGSPTTVESADAQAGSKAQQFTATANYDSMKFPNITITQGKWYEYSCYGKRTAGTGGYSRLAYGQLLGETGSIPITSETYQKYKIALFTTNANAVTPYAVRELGNSSGSYDTVIVDNFSFKEITLSTMLTGIDIEDANTTGHLQVYLETNRQHGGVAINIDDLSNPQNYILIWYGNDLETFRVYEVIAGVYTQKLTSAVAFGANARSGCVLGWNKNGTELTVYLNGAQVGSKITGLDAGVAANTKVALFASHEDVRLDNVVIYKSNQTSIETQDKLAKKNLILFDGDSTTANGNQPIWEHKYPTVSWRLLGEADWYFYNMGIGGQTAVQMAADATTHIDPLKGQYGKRNVVICFAGTNDLASGTTAANTHTALSGYCSGRKAAGFEVYIVTILPRGTNAVLLAAISDCNDLIKANYATYANGIIDLTAHTEFSDATDTTYFDADQIHLTTAGYALLASLVAAAV